MDMCRFKSRTDDGYKKILFAINLYVGQIKEKMTPKVEGGLVCAPCIVTKVLSRLMDSRFQLMKKALIEDLIQYVRNQVEIQEI
jgi:hypothetical protein